jgi:hypothetical protein
MRALLRVFGVLAFVVGVAFLTLCAGLIVIVELPFRLAFGWVMYLVRVVPSWNPDPVAVGTAVVCLVGVAVGGHWFFRWLYKATGDGEREWPWRWTRKVVALVVVMFVAGIAVTGLVHQTIWLVRSPEPLAGNGYSPVRSQSANNLKQMGLASQTYADVFDETLPRSTFDAHGRPAHSWQTQLLPFIEQDNVFRKIDRTKPWTHPANAEAMRTDVRVYRSSYLLGEDSVNGYAASHYAGNVNVVMGDAAKTAKSFPQGISQTILAGEVNSRIRAWGDPLNARDPRLGWNAHPDGFGAPNRPPLFAMLDGSVRSFQPNEWAELMDAATK